MTNAHDEIYPLAISKIVSSLILVLIKTSRKGLHNYLQLRKKIDSLLHTIFLDLNTGVVRPFCNGRYLLAYLNKTFLIVPNDYSTFYVREVEEVYLKPKPGDIVIDVGAHCGFYTLLASRAIGEKGYVIAFEPHTMNFKILTLNISLNNVNNVKSVKVALGAHSSDGKLYLGEDSGAHSIVAKRRYYIPIKVRKLDDIIEELIIENIPKGKMLIKIDAEKLSQRFLKVPKTRYKNSNRS